MQQKNTKPLCLGESVTCDCEVLGKHHTVIFFFLVEFRKIQWMKCKCQNTFNSSK